MFELFLIVLLLALVGLLAGFLAGLFGIGGGLVTVPSLYLLFTWQGVDPSTAMSIATATSLAIIIPTAVSSMRAHHRLGNLDWPSFRRLFFPVLVGVAIGSQLVLYLDGEFLALVFAILAWAIGLKVILAPKPAPNRFFAKALVQRVCAVLIGLVSVLTGVGGGALAAPMFMAAGFPVHRAIGTAASFGLLIALPGSLGIALMGKTPSGAPWGTYTLIYIPALVILSAVVIFTAPLGARLGKRLSEGALRRLFALFLFVVGSRMLWVVVE